MEAKRIFAIVAYSIEKVRMKNKQGEKSVSG